MQINKEGGPIWGHNKRKITKQIVLRVFSTAYTFRQEALLMHKHKQRCAMWKRSIIMRILPPCTIKKSIKNARGCL